MKAIPIPTTAADGCASQVDDLMLYFDNEADLVQWLRGGAEMEHFADKDLLPGDLECITFDYGFLYGVASALGERTEDLAEYLLQDDIADAAFKASNVRVCRYSGPWVVNITWAHPSVHTTGTYKVTCERWPDGADKASETHVSYLSDGLAILTSLPATCSRTFDRVAQLALHEIGDIAERPDFDIYRRCDTPLVTRKHDPCGCTKGYLGTTGAIALCYDCGAYIDDDQAYEAWVGNGKPELLT